MQPISITVRDVNGLAVVNASTTIYYEDGVTQVPGTSLFKTDGTSPLGNPCATDPAGRLQLKAIDGKYVAITQTPNGPCTTPFQTFDPSGTAPKVVTASTYNLQKGDEITGIITTYNAGAEVNIPLDSDQNFNVGAIVVIESQGTTPCMVTWTAGVTVNPSTSSMTARAQFSVIALKKNASNTWTIFGDVQ